MWDMTLTQLSRNFHALVPQNHQPWLVSCGFSHTCSQVGGILLISRATPKEGKRGKLSEAQALGGPKEASTNHGYPQYKQL